MSTDSNHSGPADRFNETHWTVVIAAGGQDSRAEVALQRLCSTYWYPLYAFVRRQGYTAHDAEDLTQAFFARLLAKGDLASVDREKGKFRSFLLASMKHFLANEWNRSQAQKRGGGQPILSIDYEDAESKYAVEPAHDLTPDKLYERRWAMMILDQAMARLRNEMQAEGKLEQFDHMKMFLTGGKGEVSYAEVAAHLDLSEGAVKTAVHRLRGRFRELLCREVAHTVDGRAEVEQELRELLSALAG